MNHYQYTLYDAGNNLWVNTDEDNEAIIYDTYKEAYENSYGNHTIVRIEAIYIATSKVKR
jgi:hypothetical protein